MKSKKIKSIISLLLCAAMLTGFAACSDDEASQEVKGKTTDTEMTDTETTEHIEKTDNEADFDSTINLKISKKGDAIDISANTEIFTDELLLEDLNGTSTTGFQSQSGLNNFPDSLSPVSSNLYVSNSLPQFYTGSIENSGIKATKVSSDVGSGYVAFDIFVNNRDEARKIYWSDTTFTCEGNEDVLSAMRIAFVNCGTVAKGADTEDIVTALPTSSEDIVMYEPDSTHHTEDSGYEDGAIVPDYYMFKEFSGVTPTVSDNKNIILEGEYVSPSLALRATDITKDENAYFNAQPGINRIRVYIWQEGNDVDCSNAVNFAATNTEIVLRAE